jgi:hypothetical protein
MKTPLKYIAFFLLFFMVTISVTPGKRINNRDFYFRQKPAKNNEEDNHYYIIISKKIMSCACTMIKDGMPPIRVYLAATTSAINIWLATKERPKEILRSS